MQQAEKEIHWSVIVAYLVSVGLAAVFSKAFYVLSTAQVILMVGLLIAPISIISTYKSPRLWFGLAHVVAAIALHPAVWWDAKRAQAVHVQFESLHLLNRPSEHQAHVLAGVALDLVHAIQSDVLFHMKWKTPWMFWLYPLSVVLAAWGLFALFKPEAKRAA